MKNSGLHIAIILILMLATSCSKILIITYGIKEAKVVTDEQISLYAKEHGFDTLNIYSLSTDYKQFFTDTNSLITGTSQKICMTDNLKYRLSQPLQYLLFDKDGHLLVHSTNCHAGGFPNLKWNKDGAFEQFPPIPLSDVDSSFEFKTMLPYFTPVAAKPLSDSTDYTCVVFWNKFMGRQSTRLVKYVQRNLEIPARKNTAINVLLVNDDNYFAEGDMQ